MVVQYNVHLRNGQRVLNIHGLMKNISCYNFREARRASREIITANVFHQPMNVQNTLSIPYIYILFSNLYQSIISCSLTDISLYNQHL